MSSLKLIDGLKEQEVYAVLRDILPNEKSDKRRITRLETFVCERAAKDRDWVTLFAASQRSEMSDADLDIYEKKAYCISPALLFQFEIYLKNEHRWAQRVKTPENQELFLLEAYPGRFDPKYPQNESSRFCRMRMSVLHDALSALKGFDQGKCPAREFYSALGEILAWHPEFEDGDRILEVKKLGDNMEDIELVMRKANGEIWGQPTKTFEQIAEESIIARSRTKGISGRILDLSDPFLGLLKSTT
jgi:hypothetical protein